MDELLDELDNSISIQYLYDNYLDILKKLSDIISSLTRMPTVHLVLMKLENG